MIVPKHVFTRLTTQFLLPFTLLIGCSPSMVAPVSSDSLTVIPPEATEPAQPKATLLPDQSTQTAEKCSSSGSIERFQIDSVLMNEPLFFSVYFPPCYSDTKAGGYPVLYALHGQNFNDEMWIDLGMADLLDELVLSREVQPFLVVMPFEEFYFRGADANNFPDALKEEVIPWVEGSLNVCAEKACRAIGGVSRGASWAVRIGLAQWDFFGSIGVHSLPTFKGDIENLPEQLEMIPFGKEPRIYLDTGRFDPEVKMAYRYEQVLNEKGIPHEWHMNDGRHNEEYWKEHMEEYIRWYADGWDLIK